MILKLCFKNENLYYNQLKLCPGNSVTDYKPKKIYSQSDNSKMNEQK